MAAGPEGDFVVVWASSASDYGDLSGNARSDHLTSGYLTTGNLTTDFDTSFYSVQGQRYAANGDPLGDEFLINTYTAGVQIRPAVAADTVGDFCVVWQSRGSGGTDTDYLSIQAQRFRVTSIVGDRVWRDTNANGVQDGGEPGVAGVTVILHDISGTWIDETQTDADGAYDFRAVPGDYYLEFVAPEGNALTSRDTGPDDTIDSAAAEDGVTVVFTLAAGSDDTTFDAGLVALPPAPETLVGDRVWLDANANGVQNGGENGVPGVTVNLFREPDPPFFQAKAATLVGTDVTDGDGYFSFSVDPGTYYLEFVCSTDSFTALDQGADDALDSDVEPSTATTSPARSYGFLPASRPSW